MIIPNHMKTNIANISSFIIIVFAIALMVTLMLLLFIPPVVIKPTAQPYLITNPNKQVRAGGTVEYVVDACKHVDVPGFVNRSLQGQRIYPLPETTSHVPKGCSKNVMAIVIPETVMPGWYYLNVDIRYDVNFLRRETYHLKTERFEVLAK